MQREINIGDTFEFRGKNYVCRENKNDDCYGCDIFLEPDNLCPVNPDIPVCDGKVFELAEPNDRVACLAVKNQFPSRRQVRQYNLGTSLKAEPDYGPDDCESECVSNTEQVNRLKGASKL